MDTFTINLPVRPLLALREFAGNKDIRNYLNGVGLEVGPAGAFLSASNGHVLGVACLSECPANVQAQFVIPRRLIDRLKPSPLDVVLTASREPDNDGPGWRVELDTLEGRISDLVAADVVVQWRNHVPRGVSGIAGQFHQAVLSTLVRASKALHGGAHPPMTISHNGPHDAALVGFGVCDFFGVAMPMRTEAMPAPPEWVDARPAMLAA